MRWPNASKLVFISRRHQATLHLLILQRKRKRDNCHSKHTRQEYAQAITYVLSVQMQRGSWRFKAGTKLKLLRVHTEREKWQGRGGEKHKTKNIRGGLQKVHAFPNEW